MVTYGYRTPACFDSRRRDLIAVGVPERHLRPLGRSWSSGVDWPESSALRGAFGELDVGQVTVQGRLGYPGLLGDLAEACTFCLEEPGVLDLFCRVGHRSSDVAAGGLGDGAGMSSPFGGEGALHLGEQGQQE